MRPARTRFADDVFADVLPPRAPSKDVVVLCDGLPTAPCKGSVLEFFSRRGFWAVHVRYRGTWESGGEFLAKPPHEDVLDVVRSLKAGAGYFDAWAQEHRELDAERVFVLGSSFGGSAAILAAADPSVTRAVSLAPVIDWRKEGELEGYEHPDLLKKVIADGYGSAYRTAEGGWDRLLNGELSDPTALRASLDPSKLLLVHAEDDDVTPFSESASFALDNGCAFIPRKKGGHLSLSAATRFPLRGRVLRFLKKR